MKIFLRASVAGDPVGILVTGTTAVKGPEELHEVLVDG
jgi:hypothetical protein